MKLRCFLYLSLLWLSSFISVQLFDMLFLILHHQEQFEALFRAFDPGTSFQFFKSFRRVRINFTDALAAAEARVKLHKSDFNGKEMRLYFAQVNNPHKEVINATPVCSKD